MHAAPAFEPEIFRIPFPSDFDDENPADLIARANALCGAAEAIAGACAASGQPLPTPTAQERDAAHIAFSNPTASNLAASQTTAATMLLTAMLNEFDTPVVQNAQQVRNFVTNNLIMLASDGKTEGTRVRCLELLGKIKDVGLFEERSTVLVEHMTTDQIKEKLREKFSRIKQLNSIPSSTQSITDVVPRELENVPANSAQG
jgi:hypothetical protein